MDDREKERKENNERVKAFLNRRLQYDQSKETISYVRSFVSFNSDNTNIDCLIESMQALDFESENNRVRKKHMKTVQPTADQTHHQSLIQYSSTVR